MEEVAGRDLAGVMAGVGDCLIDPRRGLAFEVHIFRGLFEILGVERVRA